MSEPAKSTSPDGRYAIYVDMLEARMSHWIECPSLVDTRSGETLLRFSDSNWSMDRARWNSDAVVPMDLRKYPGDHRPASFEVAIDCTARTATVAGTPAAALGEVEAALERLYLAAKR
ncbi:MAG: hypothetical protein JWN73_2330 [Betaproteobacteria bacterium]|nr:hypothetical protein [Betaproteobacteria bacterium]